MFLFNETDCVQRESNKRGQPLAVTNGVQTEGGSGRRVWVFGVGRCRNEPEESPPQLTHGKKVGSEVGGEIAGFQTANTKKGKNKKERRMLNDQQLLVTSLWTVNVTFLLGIVMHWFT